MKARLLTFTTARRIDLARGLNPAADPFALRVAAITARAYRCVTNAPVPDRETALNCLNSVVELIEATFPPARVEP